jgi:hypothetical protein
MSNLKFLTMKKIQFLFLSFALLFFASCEKDSSAPSEGANLNSDSELTALLLRVSKTAPSFRTGDDDKPETEKGCFQIKLPAKFDFSGSEFEIKTPEDYEKIQKAIQAYIKDLKSTTFGFPMTLIVDGAEVVVNNPEELKEAIKKCHKYDDDDAIDEIDIKYPITISLTENGTKKDVVINTDDELKAFIKALKKSDSMTLSFPISITNDKGETITANNNNELRDLIRAYIKKQIDSIKIEFNNDMANNFIAIGTFEIVWNGEKYTMTFSNDGTVALTTSKGLKTMGTWKIETEDGVSKLKLKFDDASVKIMSQDFIIKNSNFSSFSIEGKDDKGNIIQINIIRFSIK